MFLVPGTIYGILSGEIKNTKDLGSMIAESLGSMGVIYCHRILRITITCLLEWSNLGVIAAVKGAKLLQHQNGIVLIIGIILLSALVNMLVGSASAKWGILAPIFVPMLILVGFHPAFTQSNLS